MRSSIANGCSCPPDANVESPKLSLWQTAGTRNSSARSASAFATHNQFFPHDWRCLTSFEIVTLLDAIDALASGSTSPVNYPVPGLELAAFLAGMFWTGCDPEHLIASTVAATEPTDNSVEISYIRQRGSSFWSVTSTTPKTKGRLAEGDRCQSVPTVERLRFRTATSIFAEDVIDRFLETLPIVSSRHQALFTRDSYHYQDAISRLLASLNAQHDTRLTVGRIVQCTFLRLSARQGGNPAIAALITGRTEPSASAPLYYCCPRERNVQKLYSMASAEIITAVWRESYQMIRRQPQRFAPSGDQYIGSANRPRGDFLIGMLRTLRSRVRMARDEKDDVARAIGVHNGITLYLHWSIAISAGFRPVKNALILESEIDRKSGFAFISDKDSDDYRHARLVWLPPELLTQIDLWRAHWSVFRNRGLATVNARLFDDLFAKRNVAESAKAVGSRRSQNVREPDQGYFLFNSVGEPQPLEPNIILEHMGSDFPLRPNLGRHYLWNRLRELGCPEEVAAAFMGHWSAGEDPWGWHSGLSPIVFRQALAPCLEAILEEIEWKPLSGFGEAER